MNHFLESLRMGAGAFIMIVGATAALLLLAGVGGTISGKFAEYPIGELVSLMAIFALVSIACFSLSFWLWTM